MDARKATVEDVEGDSSRSLSASSSVVKMPVVQRRELVESFMVELLG